MADYRAFMAHYNSRSAEIWAVDKDSAKEKAERHFNAPRKHRDLIIIIPRKQQ